MVLYVQRSVHVLIGRTEVARLPLRTAWCMFLTALALAKGSYQFVVLHKYVIVNADQEMSLGFI